MTWQMTSQMEAARANNPLKMRIEGMDCGACAIKIEGALKRIPGITDIQVSYATGMLSLRLDEGRTRREKVEATIRELGYTSLPFDAAAVTARGSRADNESGRRWWRSRKGRAAMVSGTLLIAAFVVSRAFPDLTNLAFAAAAVVGLLPVANRAMAGIDAGMPFGIETLMTLATVGAILIGAPEEAAVVIFLFAVGECLEGVAAARSRAGIEALMEVVPRVARIEEDEQVREIPVQQLKVNDVVLVRSGDRIPSDGHVIDGQSEVNEAPITGESMAVAKSTGDLVYAGSVNGHGALRVRLTHTAADNTIARIIHLIEEAQDSKAPTARFIDDFALYYTPAAMAAASLVMVLPPLLLGADWYTWLYRGLAVLLISCPCALVISTPAAIASALAAGARHGLLIKGGAALETLGKVRTIAFDKTGTLTIGRPRITDIIAIDGGADELLATAASVEIGSIHPLGNAIAAAAEARGLTLRPVFGGATAVPGRAVTGRLREGFIAVGSPRFARELRAVSDELSSQIDALGSRGQDRGRGAAGKRCLGLIAFRDEPRTDAAPASRAQSPRRANSHADGRQRPRRRGDREALSVEARSELLPDAKLTPCRASRARARSR